MNIRFRGNVCPRWPHVPAIHDPCATGIGGNGSIATSVRNRPLSTSQIEIARRAAVVPFYGLS
jgi:hypothetical protein